MATKETFVCRCGEEYQTSSAIASEVDGTMLCPVCEYDEEAEIRTADELDRVRAFRFTLRESDKKYVCTIGNLENEVFTLASWITPDEFALAQAAGKTVMVNTEGNCIVTIIN